MGVTNPLTQDTYIVRRTSVENGADIADVVQKLMNVNWRDAIPCGEHGQCPSAVSDQGTGPRIVLHTDENDNMKVMLWEGSAAQVGHNQIKVTTGVLTASEEESETTCNESENDYQDQQYTDEV